MPATTTFFKPEIDKAKAFVKKYQLPLACTASAVAATVLTRKIDAKIAKDFAYRMGKKAGVQELHLELHWEFLDRKDLMTEYDSFVADYFDSNSVF